MQQAHGQLASTIVANATDLPRHQRPRAERVTGQDQRTEVGGSDLRFLDDTHQRFAQAPAPISVTLSEVPSFFLRTMRSSN